MNILVLCTGNSARSILLEYILGTDPRIKSFSAGSKPTGSVNPASLRLLSNIGVQIDGYSSKSWDTFSTENVPHMDIVITVCGNARDETCPYWPGNPLRAHWGVDDPANAIGSEIEIDRAFLSAYNILNQRAQAFLSQPIESMSTVNLQALLNNVSTIGVK